MTETVRHALVHFHSQNRLDSAEASRPIWLATLGSMIIPLPNFRWRREAIDIHDAHHLITKHSTSVEGELCLAAWELGVNCYSHWAARFLCRVLMVIGLLSYPKNVLNSYQQGRTNRRQYNALKSELLDMELMSAQSLFHKELTHQF